MQDTIQYGSLRLTRYFPGYRSFHLHLGVACCGGLNTPGKHRWAVILDSWLLRCQKRQRWRQKQEDLEDYHLKSYFCFISLLPSFLPAAVWTKASLRGSIKLIWIFHTMTSVFGGLVYSSEPRGCPRSILNKYVRAPFEIIIHNVSPLLSSGGVNIARPCRNAFETRRKWGSSFFLFVLHRRFLTLRIKDVCVVVRCTSL